MHILNLSYKPGRLPVEDESDMWTPKNSDFGTLRAPKSIKFEVIV